MSLFAMRTCISDPSGPPFTADIGSLLIREPSATVAIGGGTNSARRILWHKPPYEKAPSPAIPSSSIKTCQAPLSNRSAGVASGRRPSYVQREELKPLVHTIHSNTVPRSWTEPLIDRLLGHPELWCAGGSPRATRAMKTWSDCYCQVLIAATQAPYRFKASYFFWEDALVNEEGHERLSNSVS